MLINNESTVEIPINLGDFCFSVHQDDEKLMYFEGSEGPVNTLNGVFDENSTFFRRTISSSQGHWIQYHKPIDEEVEEDEDRQDEVSFTQKGEPSKL